MAARPAATKSASSTDPLPRTDKVAVEAHISASVNEQARSSWTARAMDQAVDFFMSYAGADEAWAEWIAWQLEEAGYRTVVQAWDFRPGADFVTEMHRALERAGRVIAVLSPSYISSRFAIAEWNAAFARDPEGVDGRLVPVRVTDVELPPLHATRVYIDLVGLADDEACRALLAGVGHRRAKPPVPPPAPVTAPPFPGCLPRLWNVPYRSNRHFCGRVELLELLDQGLDRRPGVRAQALIGLGGVGKTQLAVEYAYRHVDRFDVVWWVRAEDPLSLKADFAALAPALGLGSEKAELDDRATVAREWLEHHAGWLLVLDNADDSATVADIVPRGGGGEVLITSQGQDWHDIAEVIVVDVLSPEAAETFLCRRSGRAEGEAARELARELGRLPLALEQAGAVVARTPALTLGRYLELYRDRARELSGRGAPPAHRNPVASTWDLALQRVAKASPAATDLLRVMAFLHADDIPVSILGADEAVAHGLATVANDRLALADATALLADYSLVRRADDDSVAVHRLVQAVVRDQLEGVEQRIWAATAMRLVAGSFPGDIDDARNWKAAGRLMTHAKEIASHIDRFCAEHGSTADVPDGVRRELVALLNHGVRFLVKSGQRVSAVALAAANVDRAELLGTHDRGREKLRADAALALAYQQAGQTDAAIDLGCRVLKRRARRLGEMDLDTVRSRAELAVSYQWARAPECLTVAINLAQQALAARETLLQPGDSDILWSRSELSWSYFFVGRLDEALALREGVSTDRRSIVDDDHPAVLWDDANLAMSYESVGRLDEALALFEQVLDARSRVLGPDHPDTAWTMGRLGNAYRAVGRTDEAIRVGEVALKDSKRVLPQDHPDTVWAQSLLARSYRSAGRVDLAVPMCEEVFADRERLLGPNHLDTTTALDELACSYQAAGRLDGALTMTTQVLAVRERVLGSDHPDTVATRRRLEQLEPENGQTLPTTEWR